MPVLTRTLLAFALGAALAAPAAYASETKPAKSKATATATTPGKAPASDAVSARTDGARESGKMKESPVSTSTTVGATGTGNANPGKGKWWADADIDGDGQLSAAEAKANAGLDSRFGTIDGDADGYVSLDEYRKFYTSEASQGEVHAAAHSAVVTRDVWVKLDANDDGKLSATEVTSNTTISGAFSTMDGNGDGFVTQAEYTAYAKANMK